MKDNFWPLFIMISFVMAVVAFSLGQIIRINARCQSLYNRQAKIYRMQQYNDDCLEHFSKRRLDCMKLAASQSFDSGLSREQARRWVMDCIYTNLTEPAREHERCIDQVLETYYGGVAASEGNGGE